MEKMQGTSIFSFSDNVFKHVPGQGCSNSRLCGKEFIQVANRSDFTLLKGMLGFSEHHHQCRKATGCC